MTPEHVHDHDHDNHMGPMAARLRALEAMLAAKGLASGGEVDGLAAAWERAAHATRHGKLILLENDPQAAFIG